MSLRMWPALLAWGAGLIHIAVAAGSPLYVLIPLTGLGAAELVWGVAALRMGRMPLVGTTLTVGLLAVLGGFGLALFDLMAWGPLASSSLMLVAVAGAAAVTLRRASRRADASPSARASVPAAASAAAAVPAPASVPTAAVPVAAVPAPASARRTLIGVVAGALLVSALTTPALAQTKAGDYAVPHGEMTGHQGR